MTERVTGHTIGRMSDFPIAPEDLDARWLATAIGAEVNDIQLSAVSGGFWSRMVRADTGDRTTILKFANPSDQSRLICSTFEFPRVEIGFYRDAAARSPVRTPQCHRIEADAAFADYVIVMEDLGHLRHLNQLTGCPPEEAGWVVDQLAELHAAWWNSPELEGFAWLHGPNDPLVAERLPLVMSMIWEAAFANLPSIPAEIRDAWPRVMEEIPTLLARLDDQPSTLAHGDVRLSNLFFGSDDASEVAFVDWQAARHTHGCYDLAYFITQSLNTDDRREHEARLLSRYLERLATHGIEAPTRAEFDHAYRLCALYCLVYPIIAASTGDAGADPDALEIADRAFTAALDLDVLDLL